MVKNNNPWKVADQRPPCSGPPYNDTLREAIICNDIINLALRFVHFRLPFIEITFTSDFNYIADFLKINNPDDCQLSLGYLIAHKLWAYLAQTDRLC